MMHESGSSFLSVGGGIVKAWSTVLGPDQPLFGTNLKTFCNPERLFFGAASSDLSRVGLCYWNPEGDKIVVSVWE